MHNLRLTTIALFLSLTGVAGASQLDSTHLVPLEGCSPSSTINAYFNQFGSSGKMPPELGRWLNDAKAQTVSPFQAFDNVYYVGICWVSAWLIKTSDGPVLIDTLYGEFTDQLIENIKHVGVDPADIKMVLLTHGHFDHVGGVAKLKRVLTNARFVMAKQGWKEAQDDARKTQGKPNAWVMPDPAPSDILVNDGDVLSVGDTQFYAYITPGHTWGTTSYVMEVKEGKNTYRAITLGGLGLNAIDGPEQVEAYISSVDRIKSMVNDAEHPISVHLTAHPFSNGLIEASERLALRQSGQPNPLVDQQGLLAQLATLRAGAVKRLEQERARADKKTSQ